MRILVDTNLLLRLSNSDHPMYPAAQAAMRWLFLNNHDVVIVPQVIYEYWVVSTRPLADNGLAMTPEEADNFIADWLVIYKFLPDEPPIFPAWRKLVTDNQVRGKPGHDARLAAAMQHHGITDILTFNKGDFARFPTIKAMAPADVSQGIAR